MVQEVVCVEAELELLRLADIEILEHSKVGVEEWRSVDGRHHARSVLAKHIWEAEAIRINVLVRPESRSRVTGQHGIELNIRRAQQRCIADHECSTRNRGSVKIHAEVLALETGEVRTAFELRDSGKLPPVHQAVRSLVEVDGIAQFDGVSCVEDMGPICGLHAIVVVQVELVERRIDNAHGFPIGVIHVKGIAPLGAYPGDLNYTYGKAMGIVN